MQNYIRSDESWNAGRSGNQPKLTVSQFHMKKRGGGGVRRIFQPCASEFTFLFNEIGKLTRRKSVYKTRIFVIFRAISGDFRLFFGCF